MELPAIPTIITVLEFGQLDRTFQKEWKLNTPADNGVQKEKQESWEEEWLHVPRCVMGNCVFPALPLQDSMFYDNNVNWVLQAYTFYELIKNIRDFVPHKLMASKSQNSKHSLYSI